MRRWIVIVGIVGVLVVGAWAWPLSGALMLAQAAQKGDATAVLARIDLERLRRSLARQIARAYLEASGKGDKLGIVGRSVAGAAATTVADPYIDELLTPDNLMALLAKGRINQIKVGDRTVDIPGELPKLSTLVTDDLLPTVTGSYYAGLDDFVVPLASGRDPDGRFFLHLRRSGLSWRLGGIDLPAPILGEMARAIAARDKAPPS